jgi:hypothetical protein
MCVCVCVRERESDFFKNYLFDFFVFGCRMCFFGKTLPLL